MDDVCCFIQTVFDFTSFDVSLIAFVTSIVTVPVGVRHQSLWDPVHDPDDQQRLIISVLVLLQRQTEPVFILDLGSDPLGPYETAPAARAFSALSPLRITRTVSPVLWGRTTTAPRTCWISMSAGSTPPNEYKVCQLHQTLLWKFSSAPDR